MLVISNYISHFKQIRLMAKPKANMIVEKPITSVMENYLEAIFDLDKDKKGRPGQGRCQKTRC